MFPFWIESQLATLPQLVALFFAAVAAILQHTLARG